MYDLAGADEEGECDVREPESSQPGRTSTWLGGGALDMVAATASPLGTAELRCASAAPAVPLSLAAPDAHRGGGSDPPPRLLEDGRSNCRVFDEAAVQGHGDERAQALTALLRSIRLPLARVRSSSISGG